MTTSTSLTSDLQQRSTMPKDLHHATAASHGNSRTMTIDSTDVSRPRTENDKKLPEQREQWLEWQRKYQRACQRQRTVTPLHCVIATDSSSANFTPKHMQPVKLTSQFQTNWALSKKICQGSSPVFPECTSYYLMFTIQKYRSTDRQTQTNKQTDIQTDST